MNTQESNALENLVELLEAQKMDEAQAAWLKLVESDGEQAAAGVRVLLAAGDANSAKNWLDAVADKQDGWLETARCMLALAQGDWNGARKHGNQAINAGVEESIIFDMAAQAAEEMELYDVALTFSIRAQRSQKSDARLIRILGLMMRAGNLDEVGELLDSIATKRPDMDVTAIRTLVACLEDNGERAAQEMARLNPQDDSFLADYARLQAGTMLHHDVSGLIEKFKTMDTTMTDLILADLYAASGDKAQAEQLLDRIAAREAENEDAHQRLELGRRYARLECFEKGRRELERVNADELPLRSSMLALLDLAHCRMKLGDKAEAMRMFEEINRWAGKALIETPAYTELYLVRLRCYMEMGRKAEAKELAKFMTEIAKDEQTRQMILEAVK